MDEEKEGRQFVLSKNKAILTASETLPFKLGETIGEPRRAQPAHFKDELNLLTLKTRLRYKVAGSRTQVHHRRASPGTQLS